MIRSGRGRWVRECRGRSLRCFHRSGRKVSSLCLSLAFWEFTMHISFVTPIRTLIFIQDFLHTIRREIASCAQSSYPSLPISSAKNLFFLDSEGAVVDFARENGWSVEDGRIYFPKVDEVAGVGAEEGADLGGQKETIENMVGYARKLEMIV